MDSTRASSGNCSSSSNESVIDASESNIHTGESDEESDIVLVPKTRTEPELRPKPRRNDPVGQFSLQYHQHW